jgi:probable rRNA maturation factor
MILLDPDLDPGPQRKTGAAKRMAGRETQPTDLRVPSPRALESFLRRAQGAIRLRGDVSVLLTTDRAIRKLNRQFRSKDKATDVLSFPALDRSQVSGSRPGAPRAEKAAGDLAISVETARRQGAAHGHSLEIEIRILILHGLLHLSGFDHEKDTGEMARREQKLRARLGLKEGLIERARVARRGRTADSSTRPLPTPSAKADSAQDDRKRARSAR